jgi:hypothetical protein
MSKLKKVIDTIRSIPKEVVLKKNLIKNKIVDKFVQKTPGFIWDNFPLLKKIAKCMKRIFGPMSRRRRKWIQKQLFSITNYVCKNYQERVLDKILKTLACMAVNMKSFTLHLNFNIQIKITGAQVCNAVLLVYKKIKDLGIVFKHKKVLVGLATTSNKKYFINTLIIFKILHVMAHYSYKRTKG